MLKAQQGHIDLEDARLVLVETDLSDLVISFEGVTHVFEGTRALCNASVRLIGVLSESVTEYGEGNVPRSVGRSDAVPVEVVEVDDSNEAKLEVQGFKRPGKWVAWTATAQEVYVMLV